MSASEPVAVPIATAEPAAPSAPAVPVPQQQPVVGKNELPPQTTTPLEADAAAVFDKLYAERQQRVTDAPFVTKFAGEIIRVYRHATAGAVFDAIGADPDGTRRALEKLVVAEDRPKLREILERDGGHPGSVDEEYVGEYLIALGKLIGGRPLTDS